MVTDKKLARALTVDNILAKKIETYEFSDAFYSAFKHPAKKGVWAILGLSSSGKSTFTMLLAKEFAAQTKVLYNMREEDLYSLDVQERLKICHMTDVKGNFLMGDYELEELEQYLSRRTSPDVVILDSATYIFKSFRQYMDLKKKFRRKVFIITLHAEGQQPRTELERSIYYDANQKIFVAGYQAICKGRTIGPTGNYIIWQEGYNKIHGQTNP